MRIKGATLIALIISIILSTGCTQRNTETSSQTQGPAAGTVVEVAPEDPEIKVNESTQVAVNVKQVTDLYGVEVHINFDAERLTVTDADAQKEGTQVMPGQFLQPDFIAQNQVDLKTGTLDYAAAQMPPHEAVNGQGTLFTFTVQGKAPGEAAITLSQALLATSDGMPITTTLWHSTLVINANP